MSDNSAGLSTDAALHRLQQIGPNTMGDEAPHPLVNALEKLWAPVPWMLEVAIVVQLGLGDYAEAGVVALLLIINAGVSLFQEGRAQNGSVALAKVDWPIW